MSEKPLPDTTASSKKTSLITFLGSSLGLFLLSSVLLPAMIGLHGYISAYFTEKRKIENERDIRTARIERLDTEIGFRYSKAMLHIQLASTPGIPPLEAQQQLDLAIAQMTASRHEKNISVLYNEFENSSGYALLSEIRDHLIRSGFDSERITQTGTIQSVLLKLSKLEDEIQLKKTDASRAAEALKSAMSLPAVEKPGQSGISRWRKGFARTDCLPNETSC